MRKILVCKDNHEHAEFKGPATEWVVWVVNQHGEWISTVESFDAELSRDGLFTCAICGADAKWVEVSENGHMPGTIGAWLDEHELIFSNGHFDEYPQIQQVDCHSPVGMAICKLLQDIHNLWKNEGEENGTLQEAREHLEAAGVIQARVWFYG